MVAFFEEIIQHWFITLVIIYGCYELWKYIRSNLMKSAIEKCEEGEFLIKSNRYTEALCCYNEVIRRFEKRKGVDFQQCVIRACVGKIITLSELGRIGEAKALYQAIVMQYGDAENSSFHEAISLAGSYLNGNGITRDALFRS